jgi:uncharacterized protein (TIGR02996 family)
MSDDELLRAAIVARPDEDLPRLVYADFLQEAGHDDRAELIRVQCALERLPPADPERPELTRREAELLAANLTKWRIAGLTGPQTFRRGMIESVETTAEALVRTDPEVLRLAPVRHLRLVNADRWTADLASLPLWRRLQSLSLNNNNFGAGNRMSLLDAADMPELRSLSLRNNRLWPEAVQQLGDTRVAARLTRLDLSGNPVSDEGVATLARHPAFAGLRELILRSDELQESDCVSAVGATSIAESQTLTLLEVLNFDSHFLYDDGLFEIANSPNSDYLIELDLSFNDIGPQSSWHRSDGVGSPAHLRRLRRLNLSGNVITFMHAEYLANWPRVGAMEWIDLRQITLDRRVRAILEASPHAAKFLLDDPAAEYA